MNSNEENPMMKRFQNVHSISCSENVVLTLEGKREICYKMNEDSDDFFNLFVTLPYIKDASRYSIRPFASNKIIEEGKFIHGFKLVQLANGEYGYIKEDTKELLPFRYDVATNFNSYGLAMVGKDGSVSWINQDFSYLKDNGDIAKEDLEDTSKFDGFFKVSDFSKGKYPLALVFRRYTKKAFYIDTTGKIKNFYLYTGTGSSFDFHRPFIVFKGKDFKDKDYLIEEEGILFSDGYYVPTSAILNFYAENRVEKGFSNQLEEFMEKEKIKAK